MGVAYNIKPANSPQRATIRPRGGENMGRTL